MSTTDIERAKRETRNLLEYLESFLEDRVDECPWAGLLERAREDWDMLILLAFLVRASDHVYDGKPTGEIVLNLVGWLIGFAKDRGCGLELISLRDCPYDLYLKTEHWRRIRAMCLEAYGHRCAVCNSADRIDVHHRTYERRGDEQPGDIIPLCRQCHGIFHANGKLAKP